MRCPEQARALVGVLPSDIQLSPANTWPTLCQTQVGQWDLVPAHQEILLTDDKCEDGGECQRKGTQMYLRVQGKLLGMLEGEEEVAR